jgi:hypothetical protein
LIFLNSSPLKPLGQMNRNLVGCIYGRSSIKFAHFPSFGSIGQTVSEEKNLKNQPITNKRHLWQPCSWTNRDEMSSLYGGPSIDGPYKVSDIWKISFTVKREITLV